MRRTTVLAVAVTVLAVVSLATWAVVAAFAPLAAADAPVSSVPLLHYHNQAEDFPSAGDEFAAALVINDSNLCPQDVVTITLTRDGRTFSFKTTPCQPLSHSPNVPGLQLRDEQQGDPTPDGEELGLFPVLSRTNYDYRYTLRVTFAGRALLTGQIETSMIWNPGSRIYDGTDAFVNTCIDKSYPLYSSNLRLYCFVPGSGFGKATIIRS